VSKNLAGAVPRKGEAMNNLTLILVGEALFWVFFTRRASFLHAVLLLFIVKCGWPIVKYDVLIEFCGAKYLWKRYVQHHNMEPAVSPNGAPTNVHKEMSKFDKELAELLDKGE
jgi:hypothetical protein